MQINEHKLALRICENEGRKKAMSVAQIKECLRVTLEELSKEKPSSVLALVEKHAC